MKAFEHDFVASADISPCRGHVDMDGDDITDLVGNVCANSSISVQPAGEDGPQLYTRPGVGRPERRLRGKQPAKLPARPPCVRAAAVTYPVRVHATGGRGHSVRNRPNSQLEPAQFLTDTCRPRWNDADEHDTKRKKLRDLTHKPPD